jgi:hypothetical protein
MACSQHLDDRIPWLEQQGIHPVLLSSVCAPPWPGRSHARVAAVAPSGIRYEARHWSRRKGRPWWFRVVGALLTLAGLPFYLLEKLLVDLDSQWSWFPLAALRGYGLCRRHRPSLIYSTGGPASSHLAAALVSGWTGIPWLAEFQDPLIYLDWPRSRRALKVYRWAERFICQRASAVIFLTDTARRRIGQRTGSAEKSVAIYPGANPGGQPTSPCPSGSHCRMAHFGSLAGSRNPVVLLEAVRGALAESPELADLIRVDFYGTCDRAAAAAIDGFPDPRVLRRHGRVSRVAALEAMRQCDVLLLIQNTEAISEETIPSKVYEYFLLGRPILGMIHANPELEAMLGACGHVPVSAADVGAVQRALVQLVRTWQSSSGQPAQSRCLRYTVESAVGRLVALGRRLSAGPATDPAA